ncbi:hypothetical protein HDU77_009767 [Chytriomyces hyalinus]|nr:hypothetical protein HDU77_009767 [Chytriomyces hyalinus]
MEISEDVSFRDSYFYTNRVFVYDMNKSIRNTGSTHRQQPPNFAAIVAPTSAAAAKSPQTRIMQSKKPSSTLSKSRDRDIKSKQFYADMLALKDKHLVRGTSCSTIKSVEPVDWATFSKLDARALKPAQSPTRKHTTRDNMNSVPHHQGDVPPSVGTSVQPRKAAAVLRSRENRNSTPTTLINNNRRETYSPLSAALHLDRDKDETESEEAAMRGFLFDPDQRLTISSKDNLFIPAFLVRHKSRSLKRPPQFPKPPQPTTTPSRSKPNQSSPTTPSTAKTATPTVSRNAQRLLKLQQYRLQRQEAPNPDQLEPPAELGYETRPMSAHAPFNLRDYIKPTGMVTEKEETDDYEKRMRSLFLPSLFAGDSVDDMKNNSAKTRRVHLVAEHASVGDEPKGDVRKTVSFQQDQPDTSKPVPKEIPPAPTSLKPPPPPPPPLIRPTSSRGGVTVTNRPDSSDMRRRLFLPPPPTRRPVSGSRSGYRPTNDDRSTSNAKLYTGTAASSTRNGVSDVYSSSGAGNLPTLRRSNSARARSANLRKRKLSTALHKPIPIGRPNLTTLATVNGVGTVVDEIPNDLSAPLLRWELAIYHVLKLNKTKKSVLDDNAGGVSVAGGGLSELTQTEIIQRAKRDRLDLVGALRVKRIYEINVGSREDKDLDILDGIIGKYHCFAKLSPVVRYKLYNCCTIETHARGTVMIREGHQARFWYILLTGECLHQLRPDTPMTVTTRVSPGGSVGEFGNLFGTAFANQETRHLRATCLMRCDFLRIEKADYLAISREAKGLDSMVFEYFTSVPAFFGVEKSILNLICQRSIVRKFDVDEVVLRAGEPCSNVYFIMKGKVRALHMVTFAKRDAGLISVKRDRRHKYILAPYKPPPPPPPTPSSFLSFSLQADKASNNSKPPPPITSGNSYLGPNDEVVRELATVLDLTNGMSFPPMRPSKVVIEQQELADAMAAAENAKNNARRISVMTPSSTRQMSMLSTPTSKQESNVIACPFHFVVVDNKLEVIAISVQDLREILPPDTLRRVMEQRSLTDVSSQEIEERYLAALGWRNSDLDGARSLRIDSFHNDGSWSNPVVKDKFKKRDEEDPVLL